MDKNSLGDARPGALLPGGPFDSDKQPDKGNRREKKNSHEKSRQNSKALKLSKNIISLQAVTHWVMSSTLFSARAGSRLTNIYLCGFLAGTNHLMLHFPLFFYDSSRQFSRRDLRFRQLIAPSQALGVGTHSYQSLGCRVSLESCTKCRTRHRRADVGPDWSLY